MSIALWWRQLSARVERPSPLEWLYLAVGLALVFRYRWIFDDSYVYFRYVDNLLFLKAGLTHNAGEYVEGFSSPLHCLLLIALRALHLSYPVIMLAIGFACFTVFWYLLIALNRAFRPDLSEKNALNFPLAFLCVNYSVTSFFTGGNETALTHVVAAANALFILRPQSRYVAILLAVSPLARPELAVSLGLTAAYVWGRTRSFPFFLAATATAVNGAWLGFRIYYYADLLPNTFYLKHAVHLDWGVKYLLDVTQPYHVGFVFTAFAALAGGLAYREVRRGGSASNLMLGPRVAMLLISLAGAAYVIRSGGSSMHYYYLAASFTLAICSLGGLLEAALAECRLTHARTVGFAGMVLILLLAFSSYPRVLSGHPITRNERMSPRPSAKVLTDPSHFRHRKRYFAQWPAISRLRAFAPSLERDGYQKWSSIAWCDAIYFRHDMRNVHGMGLTDGILARVDTRERKRGHKPALTRLAGEIVDLQKAATFIGPGMYREAVDEGRAPSWVEANLATIELIERKIYNRHDFVENLRLAFQFPPKLQIPRARGKPAG